MKDFDYEEKKLREMAWHEQKPDEKATIVKRVLHHPLFFEPSRNSFNYVFPKEQMREIVEESRRYNSQDSTGKRGVPPHYAYLSQFKR